jgi:hypothetical protein
MYVYIILKHRKLNAVFCFWEYATPKQLQIIKAGLIDIIVAIVIFIIIAIIVITGSYTGN